MRGVVSPLVSSRQGSHLLGMSSVQTRYWAAPQESKTTPPTEATRATLLPCPGLRQSKAVIEGSGGDGGDRTPDLLIANQTLSQLSYAPTEPQIISEGRDSG